MRKQAFVNTSTCAAVMPTRTRSIVSSKAASVRPSIRGIPSAAGGASYPASGFGRQMRDIAKLIKAQRGLEITALTGLHHNPATGSYWLDGNVDVNYFACAERPQK